jgi:hypothetical protein
MKKLRLFSFEIAINSFLCQVKQSWGVRYYRQQRKSALPQRIASDEMQHRTGGPQTIETLSVLAKSARLGGGQMYLHRKSHYTSLK